ncbi:MAG: O-antigen ligase family protein [Candidatus Scalinduaceae bacterium]
MKFAPQVILIASLFGWMFLSRIVNGLEPWQGEEIESFLKIVIFLFLVTNAIDTKWKFKFLIWIIIIAYADLAFVSRYQGVVAPYYENKNFFGYSLLGAIGFLGTFVMVERGILRKAEAICYLMLIVLSIAGTNSRGTYLGLGVVLIILVLNNLRTKKVLLFVIPIMFILFTRVSDVHWERFRTVSVDMEQRGTGGQRLALWSAGLRMLSTNPIFGVGSGESGSNFLKYATPEEQKRVGGTAKLHNMTLQIGAEMGMVGLGLFLVIVWLSVRDIWKMRKFCKQNQDLNHLRYLVDGLGITLVGLFVAGQFSNRGYDLEFYTIVCLAYCLKGIILREHQRVTEKQPEPEEPIIPVKWEVPFRTIMFIIFTYINLTRFYGI